MPDPELRFGLKQIMTSSWFRNTYKSPEPIGLGTKVGFDDVKVFSRVLTDMERDPHNRINVSYVRKCVEANKHSALTAYYFLLLKKKTILGEALDTEESETGTQNAILMPKDRQTKKY